jgi:autotransporter translocation and assembly factor TamB
VSPRDTTPATIDVAAPRPPRRWRRRLRRLVFGLAAAIVALVLALLGVSQTDWFRDWLRRDIMARAERLLDAKVSIARVGGDLLSGIVLDGVRLEQGGAPVITIDRIRVTYRVLTLRKTRITLDSIDVLRPVVVARQTPEGWTFARLVKPRVKPSGGAPIVFAIDALRLYDGRVAVEPLAPGRPTRIEDLDAHLAISTGPGGARVEMRAVSLDLPDRALRIGRLVGTVEKHGDVVSLTNIGLDLARSHLRVDGNVRGAATSTGLEFKVSSGAFAFDEMARLIPGVPNRPVQAAFSATVRGPVSKLATTIAFRSPAGDAAGDVIVGREGDDPARPLEFRGTLDLAGIDPGVWANTPAVAGRVDGRAVFTFAPPVASRGLPARGTFTMTRTDADVAGYQARDAEARGRFDGARVTLQRARGRAYGGSFDTRGTIGPRDPGQKGVRFDLTGRVDDIDVRRLPRPVPRLRLATDIAGAFHARLDGPQFDATMTFDASTVEGGGIGPGSIGTFALAPGVLRYGAKARLEGLDLGRLGAALDVGWLQDPRVAGPMTGDVDVQAQGRTLRDLSLTAHAVLDRATAAGGVATATTLDATIVDRRLDVDLDGDVAHVDPAVATTFASVAGDVSGHVKGHVSIADLGADISAEAVGFTGDVTLGPSRVAGRDITSASMTLALADGVLGVQRLEAATPLGAVTASGPLALTAAAASDLAYTIRGIPLAEFRAQIGDVAGTVDVEGRLRGPRAALRTEGTARFAEVTAGEMAQGLAGTAPFTVDLPDWDPSRIRLDVHPVLGAGMVRGIAVETAEAEIGYADDRASFDINASSGDRRVHVAGTADLSTPPRRVVSLTAAGVSIGEQTWVLDAARQPTIEVLPDDVRVTGLHFDDGTGQIAEADGTLALRAPAASNLQVSVRGLDLLPMEELAGQEDPEFAGLLNGIARITGPAGQPEVLGSFAIASGRFRELQFARVAGAVHYGAGRVGVDVAVEQAPGVTLAINGSVPLALFTSSDAPGAEAGAAAIGAAPIDLNIESSAIGLQIVTGLTRAVEEVTGTATVKLHVTGTADNPLFDGGVSLNGGGFLVPATGRRYRDLTTQVTFEPGRMKVDGLKVLDEEGDALEVGGVLGLRRLAFGDIQMHARARQFGFVRNHLAEFEVDLDVDVTGQVTRPTIVGKAVVEEGRVEVDRVLASLDRGRTPLGPDDGVPVVGKGQKPAPPPAPPAPTPIAATAAADTPATEAPGDGQTGAPRRRRGAGRGTRSAATPWSATELDIRVQIPENLLLRGQDIRRDSAAAGLGDISLVVGGDFRVQKNRRRPTTLVGTVTTVRGSYEYYGRRFEILRDGRIQFTGGNEIDPALDVTARRIIEPSGVEARIRVQGTARNPTLSFSSSPPLDESDILALIIFNRDLNSLGASEKGTVATMAGTAAAGMVVSPLADTLGRKLGLEEIDVQTTNDAGTPGGVVTVGDRIGDRLFVRLRQQFGAQEVSELLLEYRLSELLRLHGAVAEGDGVGGANRSLTRRVERAGLDVVFYYTY